MTTLSSILLDFRRHFSTKTKKRTAVLKKIDDLLNNITMYRLITYGLSLLVLVTIIFSFSGTLDYKPEHLIGSLLVIMASGFVANWILPRTWGIPANAESGLITCLILFFIISPVLSPAKIVGLVLAACIAIASKYLIAWHGKHVFNPAAFGAFVVGALGISSVSWWVGSGSLWIFTLILGVLIARKTKRLTMVGVFAAVSIITTTLLAARGTVGIVESLDILLFTSPLIFLGTIMLTEPSTMPPRHRQQLIFSVLAGVLFAAHIKVGPLFVYPEMALLVANIYAFSVGSKRRWTLRLVAKHKIAEELYDFEFESDYPILSDPGQYIELTLPVSKMDDRGNRRTFTIASAQTEDKVRIGVRIPEKSSRFKQMLTKLQPGDTVQAGQIAGSFVMPGNSSEKLLLIAGGVGVTPYRSMVKYLIDSGQQRDIVLLHVARSKNEFMYKSIFESAKKAGVKTQFVVSSGPLDTAVLQNIIPDVASRKVYISGPPGMVKGLRTVVTKLGVPRLSIKTDFFSGY